MVNLFLHFDMNLVNNKIKWIFIMVMILGLVLLTAFFFNDVKFHFMPEPSVGAPIEFKIAKEDVLIEKLENGLTVLFFKQALAPKIFASMSYRVGSGNESSSERGLAHLVEHMIFKGTDVFSEVDIPAIANKYGATYNAYTSFDSTSFYFEMNKADYEPFLHILANCMQNARFDENHLASELKTVVQELNMYRDSVFHEVYQKALERMFPPNHGYHFPIIGFKEELANIHAADIKKFYEQNYQPQNGLLIIAGDFDFNEMRPKVEQYFAGIKNTHTPKKPVQPALIGQSMQSFLTLQHQVQNDFLYYFWTIPGLKSSSYFDANLLAEAFVGSSNSVLAKRLIDKDKIAASVSGGIKLMHEGGFLYAVVSPKEGQLSRCQAVIEEEVERIRNEGFSVSLISSLRTSFVSEFIKMYQKLFSMAYLFSNDYFAKGHIDDILCGVENIYKLDSDKISGLFKSHISMDSAQVVHVKPLVESKRDAWLKKNEEIKKEELKILENHVRQTQVEPPQAVNNYSGPILMDLEIKEPLREKINQKLETFFIEDFRLPLVDFTLRFRNHEYLSASLDGLATEIMMMLLFEGSKGFSKEDHETFFLNMGASVEFSRNGVSCSVLNSNFIPVLERIFYIIKNPLFKKDAFEKLRDNCVQSLQQKKDSNLSLAQDFAGINFFAGTEFANTIDDKIKFVKNLTLRDVVKHHASFNPPSALCGVAGSFKQDKVKAVLSKCSRSWCRDEIFEPKDLPLINIDAKFNEAIPLLRDQVLLYLVAPSLVNVSSPLKPYLNLASIIAFNPLGSRISEIREKGGLFYSMRGSFGAFNKYFGLQFFYTNLNKDSVEEVEQQVLGVFKDLLENGITEEELKNAKSIIQGNVIKLISSSKALLYDAVENMLCGLSANHTNEYWLAVKNASVEDVNSALRAAVDINKFSKVLVGCI